MALEVVKSADPINVQPGEIVRYTVTITNLGPTDPETNIVFYDSCGAGASFLLDSLEINYVPQPGADPSLGVPLPNLALNDVVTVTYQCLVDEQPAPIQISNIAQVTSDGPESPFVSNEVVVNVEVVNMFKTASTTNAVLGQQFVYTVIISNTGAVTLEEVVFSDALPPCTSFVVDSVVLNGIPQPGEDPTAGISLADIAPGDLITINFNVTLTCIPCPPKLNNVATLSYEIERIPGGRRELKTLTSNTVMTPVANSTFKQLHKEEVVKIPPQKPDVEQLLNTLVDIEITNTKVINTITGVSLEGQTLTGYKLIVEGILNQKIEYVADEPEQSVHAAHYRVPFSTFIVLPSNFDPVNSDIEVEGFVEDIFTKLIDKRTVFKNITFIVTATITL